MRSYIIHAWQNSVTLSYRTKSKAGAAPSENCKLSMSLDTVREDFWQSTARSTIRERCKSIFNQELLSDVKFVVRNSQGGSESKKIPAHKFVLAISSPVFYAMFYGELAEKKDSIEISDCEYESLLELILFMYSDEVNLTPDNVMQLMYLAKKYMLPSLTDKCSDYLKENLDASNVFQVLPAAQKYEEKDLLNHCWEVIEKETDEAVKSDGFVTIERSVLEELIENDALNIKEVELFKALDCWAGNECEKQGLVPGGSVKRRILGERIVKGIRFPVMEQKEFVHVVLDSDILTKSETYGLMKYFNSVLNTPLGFSETKRTGQLKMISRFRKLKYGWNYQSFGGLNVIGLTVNRNIKLHAVRIFGSDNGEYSVTLTVKDDNGIVVSTVSGNFLSRQMQSELGYYPGFDIVFEPPIAFIANTAFRRIEARITGPMSWYGQSGLSRVEHSGVTFSFGSYTSMGSSTSCEKGQFCEFVFTLA